MFGRRARQSRSQDRTGSGDSLVHPLLERAQREGQQGSLSCPSVEMMTVRRTRKKTEHQLNGSEQLPCGGRWIEHFP